MASMAISGTAPSNATQSVSTAKAAPAPAETTAKAVLQPDTVKLSPAAMAEMMHRAGQSPALIAATLGTNIAAVDGYLSIKVATQASPAPVVAPVEQKSTAAPAANVQPAPAKQESAPANTTANEA